MTWLRLDDGAATHPKLLALTDSGFRHWIAVLCHCGQHRTGGHIHRLALRRLGVREQLLQQLLQLRLLEPAGDDPDEYYVHDWHVYNAPRDPTAAQRQRRRRQRIAEQETASVRSHIHEQTNRAKPHEHTETAETSRVTHPVTSHAPAFPKTITTTPSRQRTTQDPRARPSEHSATGAGLPAVETIGTTAEEELERLRALAGDLDAWSDIPAAWGIGEALEGDQGP